MQFHIKFNNNSAVVDSYGGELISFKDKNGTEYIWNGDPNYWPGRSPLLFPVIGCLKDSTTYIAGKPYKMANHGFARNSDFQVVEVTDTSVTFQLIDSAETLEVYPFHFNLLAKHELTVSGFTTTYTIINTDKRPIFFCIGGHIGFQCPLSPEEAFEDYSIIFDEVENCQSLHTNKDKLIDLSLSTPLLENTNTLPLDYSLFDKDALLLHYPKSRSVKLKHKEKSKGVKVSFDDFSTLAIWTMPKKNAPYLCIEPWIGLPGIIGESENFSDKADVITLPEREAFSARIDVAVL